jgi:hypothetical protein
MINQTAERDLIRSEVSTREASPAEVLRVAETIGLSLAQSKVVSTEDAAIEAGLSLRWPVVMKVGSDALAHKSDVGGVIVGIYSEDGVRDAFRRLTGICKILDPHGPPLVAIQTMVPPGIELILSARNDEVFGQILMLGFGGIFVEHLHDAAFRLLPVTEDEVHSMLEDLRGHELLKGYRGAPPVDEVALTNIAIGVSRIFVDHKELREVEFNPIISGETGLVAVDWRVLVADERLTES